MGLLDRISTVVKSNVNDLISKAEDPEKLLHQAIEDMQADYKKAKRQIVDSLAVQKQAEIKLRRLREDSVRWESTAMAALKKDDDELARQALGKKNKIDADIAEYESSVKTQSEYVGALKSSLAMLETKIDEAKQKRDTLVKRFRQAKQAEKRAKQLQASADATRPDALNDATAFDSFDRMVDKIELLESQVEAQRELMGDEVETQEVRSQLDSLSLDEQLAQLKAKQAGKASPAATTTSPTQESDPMEDQLAALKRKLQEG